MPEVVKSLLYMLLGGAIGAAVSWYFTRKSFEKQIRENPPINEDMIRAMFLQMGRKPSEAQVKNVIKKMNQYK